MAFMLAGTAAACSYASTEQPQGWADPVLDGSLIYYSSIVGKIRAYDLSAQEEKWVFPASQEKSLKLQGIYGRPVLDSQSIYFAAYDGNVYSVSRSRGAKSWDVSTGSPVIGGLLLKDGILYGGNSDGRVFALQAADGKKLWQQQAGRRVWSAPIDANGLIVVTSMDGDVYAFTSQGDISWKSDVASAAIASSPAFAGGRLTFGGFDKRFHAIDLDDHRWQRGWDTEPARNWFWTEGLVSGDNLYAGNLDGHIYDYDTATGKLRWRSEDLGAPIRSAPALVAGVLVVATRSGMIHRLDPIGLTAKQQPVRAADSDVQIFANLIPSRSNTVYAVTQPGEKNGARLLEIDPSNGDRPTVITQ